MTLRESGCTGNQPKEKEPKNKAAILQSLRTKLNNFIWEDGKSSVAILHLSQSIIICSLQFLLRTMKPICITTTVPWFLRDLILINECMYTTYAPPLVWSKRTYIYAVLVQFSI